MQPKVYDTLKCVLTENKTLRHIVEVKLIAQQLDEENDELYHETYEDGHLIEKSQTYPGDDPKLAHRNAIVAWKRAINVVLDHNWPTQRA